MRRAICKTRQGIVLLILAIVVTFTILGFSSGPDRYAFSQSPKINSTAKADNSGVNLINIHPSPLRLKAVNTFEIFSTVVNNSPNMITFTAGRCDTPLSVHFTRNVLVKHTQGCTATSPPFKLNSGARVTVAAPSSGTTYQAMTPGSTPATATFHYKPENGQAANVTEQFVFTIS